MTRARAAEAAAAQASINVLDTTISDWVVETLIQGAWLREYHEWKRLQKRFDVQHERSGSKKPDWKSRERASHVDRVCAQLELFDARIPDAVLDTISNRRAINKAKHRDEYFVAEEDFPVLLEAIADFCNGLAAQEEFTTIR
jgi:hypothetical protein